MRNLHPLLEIPLDRAIPELQILTNRFACCLKVRKYKHRHLTVHEA